MSSLNKSRAKLLLLNFDQFLGFWISKPKNWRRSREEKERVVGFAFIAIGTMEAGNATTAASVNHTLMEVVHFKRPPLLKH